MLSIGILASARLLEGKCATSVVAAEDLSPTSTGHTRDKRSSCKIEALVRAEDLISSSIVNGQS